MPGTHSQNDTFLASGGTSYKLSRLLADTRECPDGIAGERRTIYFCQRTSTKSGQTDEFVVKVKHQPYSQTSQYADSIATKKELEALRMFQRRGIKHTPHLIDFHEEITQPVEAAGDGRTTYLVMSKMPGQNLLDYKYWSLGVQERLEIQEHFLAALSSLWAVGIAPIDRALRNVLWEPETKTLSIVDFEMWETPSAFAMDEAKELQLWGLAHRPPPPTWHEEWHLHH